MICITTFYLFYLLSAVGIGFVDFLIGRRINYGKSNH